MKRSSMRPKLPPRRVRDPLEHASHRKPDPPRAVMVTNLDARLTVPLPKEQPFRSETYRRLVAAMSCAMCGKPGPSQCAHSDQGKGLSIKSSDLDCFPLCADVPLWRGCHSIMGASGKIDKDMRRGLERKFAAETRAAVLASGQWPEDLPKPEAT